MLRRVIVGMAGFAVVYGGCAQGSQPLLDDGSGDTTAAGGATATAHGGAGGVGGASGGSGGSGGVGGASTTSSAGGSGGQGGSAIEDAGSDAPSCAEIPCKLVAPQCGCPANKACVAKNTGGRTCIKAGSMTWGEKCGPVDFCEPGLQCLPKGLTSTCMKLCATDAECQAPGGLCVIPMNDKNGQPFKDVAFCSESCDPSTNAGCPVAGTGCGVGQEQAGQLRFFTICVQSGKATQGQACQTSADCAPKFGCVTSPELGSTCAKWCDEMAPSCPGGTSCQPVQINGQEITIGNAIYGACL